MALMQSTRSRQSQVLSPLRLLHFPFLCLHDSHVDFLVYCLHATSRPRSSFERSRLFGQPKISSQFTGIDCGSGFVWDVHKLVRSVSICDSFQYSPILKLSCF
jgi:hypothetical protein